MTALLRRVHTMPQARPQGTRLAVGRLNMAVAFPFSAIVGQDEMKLALMIAAVDPSVGGVLVFGPENPPRFVRWLRCFRP